MSVLRARYGLLEMPAASLSLLRRGQRPVRGRLWDNGSGLRMFARGTPSSKDEGVEDAFTAEERNQELHQGTERVPERGQPRYREHRQAEVPDFEYAVHQAQSDVTIEQKPVTFVPWGPQQAESTVQKSATERVQNGDQSRKGESRRETPSDSHFSVRQNRSSFGYEHEDIERDALPEGYQADERYNGEFDALLDLDYARRLPDAVSRGDADLVMRCLRAAEVRPDMDFIANISGKTFTEILHILGPRRNIGELFSASKNVSKFMSYRIGMMRMNTAAKEYGWVLLSVAMSRRQSGIQITEEQYRILLEYARDLGNRYLAMKLWGFLHEDGVVTDLAMYNALLASFVLAGRHNATGMYRERVIQRNMIERRKPKPIYPYHNYRVGVDGIKERSMIILDAMVKKGITGNEETYCLMITAASKEGEVATVKSILQTVWNIDVDKVMAADPEERKRLNPRKLPTDHPQYPSEKLTWAVAHGFGINNDIPAALRLVDYISREYQIPISHETWSVLFEYTFVLSCQRTGLLALDDARTGELPWESVLKLWETMTGPPYFVKPDMAMYNRMMKNLHSRCLHFEMLAKMVEASSLCAESMRKRRDRRERFLYSVKQETSGRQPDLPATRARRSWEAASITHARNSTWMKRWVRFFLKMFAKRAQEGHKAMDWSYPLVYETLPRVLLAWRDYVNEFIRYETPTGMVTLEFRSEREVIMRRTKCMRLFEEWARTTRGTKFLVGDNWVKKECVNQMSAEFEE